MGGLFSALDACTNSNNSPADYMEKELEKEKEKAKMSKQRMDIGKTAFQSALKDIRSIMGIHSDNEEN